MYVAHPYLSHRGMCGVSGLCLGPAAHVVCMCVRAYSCTSLRMCICACIFVCAHTSVRAYVRA